MKRVEGKAFRCALCGKFASEGVTEDDPKLPTTVCRGCVFLAGLIPWPPRPSDPPQMWAKDFSDVDEGDGYYWAFVRTEDDGTGKQCPEWFVVEVGHGSETDEPFIIDTTIPEYGFHLVMGWGPRLSTPDHLVSPTRECRECGEDFTAAELDEDGQCWACTARKRGGTDG